jgi:hypothetical protein
MKTISSFILLLMVAGCAVPVAGQSDDTVKAILLEHTVELVPKRENDAADFTTISVLVEGKLLKQFAAQNVSLPNVVATFNGLDADYLVYRTHSGQGACVSGDIYVLKFSESSPGQKTNVSVSPALSGCLGENPPVSFDYDAKFNVIITLGVDKINGNFLTRWVRAPKPAGRPVRRKTT